MNQQLEMTQVIAHAPEQHAFVMVRFDRSLME